MPEPCPAVTPVLTVQGLCVRLGGPLLQGTPDHRAGAILHGIDLYVAPGERVALLGRNGAGKTTLLRAILGLLPMQAGTLCLDGQDVTHWPTDRRARSGLAYVPQGRQLYATLTVEQNLVLAALHARPAANTPAPWPLRCVAQVRRALSRAKPDLTRAYQTFPTLYARRTEPAGVLSGGQQQQLAVARALLARPRLIMLDEPLEGIQPSVVTELAHALETCSQNDGTALLWVDQNLEVVLQRCTRVVFMERGAVVACATAAALRADRQLIERYLGA